MHCGRLGCKNPKTGTFLAEKVETVLVFPDKKSIINVSGNSIVLKFFPQAIFALSLVSLVFLAVKVKMFSNFSGTQSN